jgi:hypothetical protein
MSTNDSNRPISYSQMSEQTPNQQSSARQRENFHMISRFLSYKNLKERWKRLRIWRLSSYRRTRTNLPVVTYSISFVFSSSERFLHLSRTQKWTSEGCPSTEAHSALTYQCAVNCSCLHGFGPQLHSGSVEETHL